MGIEAKGGIRAGAIGGAKSGHLYVCPTEIHDIMLRKLNSFRFTGRAGSIEYHHRQLRLRHINLCRILRKTGKRRRFKHPSAICRKFLRHNPGVGKDQVKTGILHHKFKSFLREVRVKRHICSPRLHYGKRIHRHQFRPLDHNTHTVATAYAKAVNEFSCKCIGD